MENPVELLDQKLRDMEEQLNKAKLGSAQILGNVHEIEKKMNLAKKEADDYEEKIKLALSKGNEELAKKTVSKIPEFKKDSSNPFKIDDSELIHDDEQVLDSKTVSKNKNDREIAD